MYLIPVKKFEKKNPPLFEILNRGGGRCNRIFNEVIELARKPYRTQWSFISALNLSESAVVKASVLWSYPPCVYPLWESSLASPYLLPFISFHPPSLSSVPLTLTLTSSSSFSPVPLCAPHYCSAIHPSIIPWGFELPCVMPAGFLWQALLFALIRAQQMVQRGVSWKPCQLAWLTARKGFHIGRDVCVLTLSFHVHCDGVHV